MLKWWIGQWHVSTSNRTIIRELRARMVHGLADGEPLKNWTATTDKAKRKAVYAQAVAWHKENQDLYNCVMR